MGMIMKNGVPYAHGSEIPQGGTKGQVLAKASNLDGDMVWKDEEGGSSSSTVAEESDIFRIPVDYSVAVDTSRITYGQTLDPDEPKSHSASGTLTGDHTYAKIVEALNAGKNPVVMLTNFWAGATSTGITIPMQHYVPTTGDPMFIGYYGFKRTVSNASHSTEPVILTVKIYENEGTTKVDISDNSFPNLFERVKALENAAPMTSVKQIDVDALLSDTSENPVQNKVVTSAITTVRQALQTVETALTNKQDALTAGTGAKIENDVISFNYVTAGKKAVAYSGPYTKTVDINLQYKDADYTFTEYIDFGNMGFTSPSDYSLEIIGSIVHNSSSSIIATCLVESEVSRTIWSGTRTSFTVSKENNRIRLSGWFTGPSSGYQAHKFTCSILCKVYCAGVKPTDTTNIIMQAAGTGGICPQTLGIKGSVAEIPMNSTTPITVDISALNIDTDYTRETFVQFDYYSYYNGLRQTVVCEGTGGIFNLPITNSAAGDVVMLEARVNGVEGGKLTDIVFTPLGASQGCSIYRVVWGKYTGGGGGGETPTLDAVLKKGNDTDRSARFTDELNGVQAEIYANGTYMTGNGTEGMRQFSVSQNGIRAVDNLVGTITPKFVVPFEPSGEDQVAMSDAVKASFRNALDTNAKITFDDEYQYLQIRDGNGTDIGFSKDTANTVRIQEYAKDDRGHVQTIFDETLTSKTYVDGVVGDLATLTTTDKSSSVAAINEIDSALKGLGEPFRIKNWASGSLNVTIPYCTEDLDNTAIAKMDFNLDDVEGADYQVVGMIAYEVFGADGKRINCWPVCQFTGNGQKTLSVRWACMGTTRKVATKLNAWVLLKHR